MARSKRQRAATVREEELSVEGAEEGKRLRLEGSLATQGDQLCVRFFLRTAKIT